jgi:hypothetical protein
MRSRRHIIPNYHTARGPGGVFVPVDQAAPTMRLTEGLEIYNQYLAAVCLHQGLTPRGVQHELGRRGELTLDPQWRRASYARQLAIYLAHTEGKVPQKMLGRICGITPSGICRALQSIEDVRDHRDYDQLIETIAVQMKAVDA